LRRIGNNPEKIISLIFAVLPGPPGLSLDGVRRGLIENLHRAVNPSLGDRRGRGRANDLGGLLRVDFAWPFVVDKEGESA
jgi:hypothetical protein